MRAWMVQCDSLRRYTHMWSLGYVALNGDNIVNIFHVEKGLATIEHVLCSSGRAVNKLKHLMRQTLW